MKILMSVLLICGILILSCSKKSDAPQTSKKDHLTSSSWRLDKASTQGIDITTQVPLCSRDNLIRFQVNGTGTIDESTNVCSPPAPSTFGWSFQNNETVLRIDSVLVAGASGDFNIVTLNQTELVLSQNMIIPPLGSTPVVVTFKH